MRLLNVWTGRLEEFFKGIKPEYAILSHTWGQEEISYNDLIQYPAPEAVPKGNREDIILRWNSHGDTAFHDRRVIEKHGYKKLRLCCGLALRSGYKYVWIDTCCIDKSSSSELSEAINSMYKWYQDSKMCYVYLEDITVNAETVATPNGRLQFTRSRWFTRGWTLQELIAPGNVWFWNQHGESVGTRSQLAEAIASITGIDKQLLLSKQSNHEMLQSISIARRMSWAAKRMTTREEDIAYCLLGIFDVNMPLLYGEGDKAFRRLQEEIIKYSNDESLLAWVEPTVLDPCGWYKHGGWFALSPAFFIAAADIIPIPGVTREPPILLTSKGLQCRLQLANKEAQALNPNDGAVAPQYGVLNCRFKNDPLCCVGIYLEGDCRSGFRRYVPDDKMATETAHSEADEDIKKQLLAWGSSIKRINEAERASAEYADITLSSTSDRRTKSSARGPKHGMLEVFANCKPLLECGFKLSGSSELKSKWAPAMDPDCFLLPLGPMKVKFLRFEHHITKQTITLLIRKAHEKTSSVVQCCFVGHRGLKAGLDLEQKQKRISNYIELDLKLFDAQECTALLATNIVPAEDTSNAERWIYPSLQASRPFGTDRYVVSLSFTIVNKVSATGQGQKQNSYIKEVLS